MRFFALLVLLTVPLSTVSVPRAQAPSSIQRPNFAGTWAPAEPDRSDQLFNVGLGWIPGSGRLIIEQRPDRLTLTKDVPDDKLDPLLDINGQFAKTVVYRITEARGRSGGFGAGGDQRATSWQDDRLVLVDARSGTRPVRMTFSLDGDRLKFETHVVVSQGHENNVTEWFTRVR